MERAAAAPLYPALLHFVSHTVTLSSNSLLNFISVHRYSQLQLAAFVSVHRYSRLQLAALATQAYTRSLLIGIQHIKHINRYSTY